MSQYHISYPYYKIRYDYCGYPGAPLNKNYTYNYIEAVTNFNKHVCDILYKSNLTVKDFNDMPHNTNATDMKYLSDIFEKIDKNDNDKWLSFTQDFINKFVPKIWNSTTTNIDSLEENYNNHLCNIYLFQTIECDTFIIEYINSLEEKNKLLQNQVKEFKDELQNTFHII
jgi:hypothetical protein